MALNHMTLQGRFVEAPVCGQTKGGTDFANFRLAWNEKYKEKETKLFIECKAFSTTAKFISQYMNKSGMEIIAEGKLNTDEWTGQDSQKRSKIVMIVERVHFSGKKQDSGTAEAQSTEAQPTEGTPVETDELPF